MDKVLAFSILSASPADLSSAGGGFGGSWAARLSWRRGAVDDQRAPRGEQQQQQEEEGKEDREKRDPRSRDGGAHASGGGAAAPPRFAPEFDGIDWFGTIVSR